MNKFKDCVFKLILLTVSVAVTISIIEFGLRLTKYNYYLEQGHPRGYYKADEFSGYDIQENFQPKKFSFIDSGHEVWSNEVGCFDKTFQEEMKYILLAGDSFTWGYVPYKGKFGTILEKLLNYRVLKCGVVGYGTRQELEKIKKVVDKIEHKPQLIIVGYFLNDFEEDYLFPHRTVVDGYFVQQIFLNDKNSGDKTVKPRDLLEREVANFIKYGSFDDEKHGVGRRLFWWVRKNSIIFNLVKRVDILRKIAIQTKALENPLDYEYLAGVNIDRYKWLENAWNNHLDNIKKIKSLSDAYGSKLVVVIIPDARQLSVDKKPNGNYDIEQASRIVKAYLEQEKIDYLDIAPQFKDFIDKRKLNKKTALYWPNNGHLNTKGNLLTSLIIAQHILEKNLLDVFEIESRKKDVRKKYAELLVE